MSFMLTTCGLFRQEIMSFENARSSRSGRGDQVRWQSEGMGLGIFSILDELMNVAI